MSDLRSQGRHGGLAAERVANKLRSHFPTWAAASEANTSENAGHKGQHTEFLLVSNWILRPAGLLEFVGKLQKHVKEVQISYDMESASPKIRCLASEEGLIMAVCQLAMDDIVRGELAGGYATSAKIITRGDWIANKQGKEEYIMALAPPEILGFTHRSTWVMPEQLVKKDVSAHALVPGKALAKLENLAGCTITMTNDGIILYIGAESQEKIAIAKRKLDTLAKFAALPQKTDTYCESFVYAEDRQKSLATFTYLAHGTKSLLTTFFLDRAKQPMAKERSTYKSIFGRGVVITLASGNFLQRAGEMGIIPAVTHENEDEPYKAFQSPWQYRPKEVSRDPVSYNVAPPTLLNPLVSNPNSEMLVTSWIHQLPAPESILRHGNGTDLTELESSVDNGRSRSLSTSSSLVNPDEQLNHPVVRYSPRYSSTLTLRELQRPDTYPRQTQTNFRPEYPRFPNGNASQDRGNINQRQNRYEPQRSRGNQTSRSYWQGTTWRHPDAESQAATANGVESPLETRLASDPQPTIPRKQDQVEQPESTIVNLGGRRSSDGAWIPPHLRYIQPRPQPSIVKEPLETNPKVSQTDVAELDSDRSSHQQRLGRLRTNVNRINEEAGLPQPQDQETESLLMRSSAQPILPGASNGSRAGHSTMRQQAGRPRGRGRVNQGRGPAMSREPLNEDPEPELIQAMSQKLVRMMSSLEVFTGNVSLKAELGRLCITQIDEKHIHVPGKITRGLAKSLREIKEVLDKRHVSPQDLIFTSILTAEGGDANYIALMEDGSRKRVWSGISRHTVYELSCHAATEDKKMLSFIVEIDGRDFTYRVYEVAVGSSCSMFVHCPKRSWDFQVTLSKSRDLEDVCGDFVRDLINDMRITTQKPLDPSDPSRSQNRENSENQDLPKSQGPSVAEAPAVPDLEFVVKKAYGEIDINCVRTRNIARYAKNTKASPSTNGPGTEADSILEICEVHDMERFRVPQTGQDTFVFRQSSGDKQLGQLPTWYEASLQSKMVNEALQQNRDLEFGEEVEWSPEKLQKAGAFDGLLRSTIEMVKKIDGVGFWGDNHQEALNHSTPSTRHSRYSFTPTIDNSIW